MSQNIWKSVARTVVVVFLGAAIFYGIANLIVIENQSKAVHALIDAQRITLLPGNSLNFTFTNKTLIFIASDLPLKIEPQNIETYFLEHVYEVGIFNRRTFNYAEIVAPPNVTVRVTNNYTAPVSLAVNTMVVGPYREIVNGMLIASPVMMMIFMSVFGVAGAAYIISEILDEPWPAKRRSEENYRQRSTPSCECRVRESRTS